MRAENGLISGYKMVEKVARKKWRMTLKKMKC
jgi:hypothetical protein